MHWQEGLLLHAFQTPSTLCHVYFVDLKITTAVTLNGCLHRLSGCWPCRNRYCSASACQILKFFTATSIKLMQFNDGIFIVARQTGGAKPNPCTSLEPPLGGTPKRLLVGLWHLCIVFAVMPVEESGVVTPQPPVASPVCTVNIINVL